jgi:hypothetical protein
MSRTINSILQWSESERADFGCKVQCTRHRLHDLDLFTDDALIRLLDAYPRKSLQAFTMGTDPSRREDWAPVEIGQVSGSELFDAVRKGRLWLNILRVEEADARFKELMDRIYGDLVADCPHFKPFRYTGTLLVSSPDAQVYYHVDGPPNLLWHIRGAKRIYIYPANDRKFVPQNIMEDIFASVADEEMPYDRDFDKHAVYYDLQPGDVASWPHNAPHRVVNDGSLNVSLSTNHGTPESEHRKLVYLANRFFHRRWGLPATSTREEGLVANGKCLAYRAFRKAGLDPVRPTFDYRAKYRVDPLATSGITQLREAARTAFAE